MLSRPLGSSGMNVSLLGLGCNSLGHISAEEGCRLVTAALDQGVTFFDTANVYAQGRSEEELGRLIPRGRDDVLIATKFGHPSSVPKGVAPCAPDQVLAAVDASLARLHRDTIDVLLIHFPDPDTPLIQTLLTLSSLLQQGKIKSYGVSNFSAQQLRELLQAADSIGMARPLLVQDEYSLLCRGAETKLLPEVLAHGLGFVPFFPLASGLLTGRYRRGQAADFALRAKIVRQFEQRFLHENNRVVLEALHEISDQAAVPLNRIALQWLAGRRGVSTIIAGASTRDQFVANAQALAMPLPAGILEAVDRVLADVTLVAGPADGRIHRT